MTIATAWAKDAARARARILERDGRTISNSAVAAEKAARVEAYADTIMAILAQRPCNTVDLQTALGVSRHVVERPLTVLMQREMVERSMVNCTFIYRRVA